MANIDASLEVFAMLYSDDENDDYLNVLASIDGFTEGFQMPPLSIDEGKIGAILRGMRHDFPAQGGSTKASPFKKAANFLCYFVSEQPVKNPFARDRVGDEIPQISNHQNAMVALHIAFDALHNATIRRSDAELVVLSNRISISKHSYIDLIQACSKVAPNSHFHIVSVLLEQICYRSNPAASYEHVT